MRWVIWLLMIFVAAVLTVFYVSDNTAFVSFFMTEQQFRYDLRFNYFIILLVCVFILCHLLLRSLNSIFKFPSNYNKHSTTKREQHSHNELELANIQLLAGEYTRAKKNANKALKHYSKNVAAGINPELGVLSHLAVAAASHRLGDKQTRNEQVEKALKLADRSKLSEAADAVRLQQIQWMIEEQDSIGARKALSQLDHKATKRVPTLKMRLQVDRMDNAPFAALETVRMLVKHDAYPNSLQAEQVIAESAGKLLDSATDENQLLSMWNQLQTNEQKQPSVSAYGAMRFAQFGNNKQAIDLIAQCWSELNTLSGKARLALLYTLDQVLPDTDANWIKHIEQALQQTPQDPILNYLAARIYALNNLEDKALPLLENASKQPELSQAFRQKAWLTLANIAENHSDEQKANLCYKAAAQLNHSGSAV